MKFARRVFAIAGVWGILVLTPLYFRYDGRAAPPPGTAPEIYFGFLAAAFAAQMVYLVIASDPLRFRPLMLVGVFAKLWYVATIAVLYQQGRTAAGPMAYGAFADFGLAVLFLAAFLRLRHAPPLTPSHTGRNARRSVASDTRGHAVKRPGCATSAHPQAPDPAPCS